MHTGEQEPTLPQLKAQRGAGSGSGVSPGLLTLLCCCVAPFMCALGLAWTSQSTMHMICGCSLGSIEYNQKFFTEQ